MPKSLVDAYLMPQINDLIDQLGKAKFITTLDLTRGYWQVPTAKPSRHLTVFTPPFGLFQFQVMSFGLQGAPATFQRLMDKVLQGMEDYAAAYIDDMVIHSATWEEHLTQIQTVLQRLQSAGLTAKPQKCQLEMSRCVYLCYVVCSGLVQPERSKVQGTRCRVLSYFYNEETGTVFPGDDWLLQEMYPRLCQHCSTSDRPHADRMLHQIRWCGQRNARAHFRISRACYVLNQFCKVMTS